jgi:putative spermidine/putrescine transport system ATP-binding protein
MLAGFEVPTEGEIVLDGTAIRNTPPHLRGIGMVFQNYALFPHMTIEENVAFPLMVRGVDRATRSRAAREALDMVKLESLWRRRPGQLSGGQQQRVALARALVFKRQLVLMDEPLGALDKQLREHMQLEIKQIHKSLGVTVVYVTHDQTEALTMSDRIAVFNDGVIQQLDTPHGLYEAPRNRFVANFIGENNTLSGVVEEMLDGGFCRVRLADGHVATARAVKVEGVGAATYLSMRPEKVHVEDYGPRHVNRLMGTVKEAIYHGDHTRVRLNVAGNPEFTVKMRFRPNRPIPEIGERIAVAFAAEDCLALDAPEDEAARN